MYGKKTFVVKDNINLSPSFIALMQTLKNRVVCQVRALVVLPVRELAVQVHKVIQSYCKGTHLKVRSFI